MDYRRQAALRTYEGSEGLKGLRDEGCCECGIVDVQLAYFPLLLLRGTVPLRLW